MHGYFQLIARDVDKDEIVFTSDIMENTLTNVNRNIRNSMLLGSFTGDGFDVNDLSINYIALGSGETASTIADTQLENEIIRRLVTRKVQVGNEIITTTIFPVSVANFRIREIGVFAGNSATTMANTGNMISRINVDFTKTNNVELTIRRIDRTVI